MARRKKVADEQGDETPRSPKVSTPVAHDPVSSTVGTILDKTPVYQDLIQPSAKKLGKGLVPTAKVIAETTNRTVKMALAPLMGLLWGWERIQEIILPELGRRFEDKLHRLITPELTVAGPVLESLRFAGGKPLLREMYVNLLATAMDKETAEKAHPAFAEIIRQMTPDEARIVQFFSVEKSSPVVTYATQADSIIVSYEFTRPAFSLVDLDVKCDLAHLIPSYFDNLRRLEILTPIQWNQLSPADPRFKRLMTHDAVRQQESELRTTGIHYMHYFGMIGLTSFGTQFCDACVGTSPSGEVC